MEWPSDWVLVVLAIVLGIYIFGTWPFDYFKKRNLPFVKPRPFVGNMGPFAFKRLSFGDSMINLYNSFKGYSVGGYFQFLTPSVMIRDPEILKMIAVKDFDFFTDHRSAITEEVDPLFGSNMFALKGKRWRDMRHTLSPAFTSSKMKAMFFLVQETGTQLGVYLEQKCKATKDGLLTLEMKDLFTRYTNDVIASAAFGINCNSLEENNNEFYLIGKSVSDFGGIRGIKLLGFLGVPWLMKMLRITFVSKHDGDFFRSLVHGNMETREREKIVRPDMIHLLMQAKKGTLKNDVTDEVPVGDSEEKDKKRMVLSDDDITANALLFFLAGFDTSSTLLCFMSHLLAVHPDIQRRVKEEMDEVLQENDGEITYEGIQKMKYLDMVISETLRMYPPAVFTDRVCVKPYIIPATSSSPTVHLAVGDSIAFPIIAIHRDPEFFPNPMKFDPERFSEENKHKIRPFTYLPFGVGPRNCIGMRFALMEAKIAFTCLLTRFNIEVVSKTTIPIVLHKKSFNMGAEGGFWLGLRPRTTKAQ